jgi:hypothetical protein
MDFVFRIILGAVVVACALGAVTWLSKRRR